MFLADVESENINIWFICPKFKSNIPNEPLKHQGVTRDCIWQVIQTRKYFNENYTRLADTAWAEKWENLLNKFSI